MTSANTAAASSLEQDEESGEDHRSFRRAVGFAWIGVLVWSLRHCPCVLRACRPLILRSIWRCSPWLRTNLLLNAARILGPHSTASQRAVLGRAVLANFVGAIEEVVISGDRTDAQFEAQLSDIRGVDAFWHARSVKRGLILVTAHLGAFETGMFLLRRYEPRVHVVFRRDAVPAFEAARSKLRARLGVLEAPVDDGLATWLRLRDALNNDEVILMQGDRVMDGQRGVSVPFMHGHILLPAGPMKLALATGAPIMPIFAPRQFDGRVCIVMNEPIFVNADRSSDGADQMMRKIATAIEAQVRDHPEQWLAVHRAWCEDSQVMAASGSTR